MLDPARTIQTVKLKIGGYAKYEGFNVSVQPPKVRVRKFIAKLGTVELSDTVDEVDASEITDP